MKGQASKMKSMKEKETSDLSSKEKELKSEIESLQKLKRL
jgi:hypothetical protein